MHSTSLSLAPWAQCPLVSTTYFTRWVHLFLSIANVTMFNVTNSTSLFFWNYSTARPTDKCKLLATAVREKCYFTAAQPFDYISISMTVNMGLIWTANSITTNKGIKEHIFGSRYQLQTPNMLCNKIQDYMLCTRLMAMTSTRKRIQRYILQINE